ncbi:MAG: phosphomannomutase/phosphoglucomutase [Candidatus Andersenbacteria bacterium]
MPQINPAIFKAYDIRGRYPAELNEGSAYLVGRAFAHFLKARKIVAGYDCRESSPSLFDSFVRGVIEEGTEVHALGLASTPYVYFAANQADYDGAVNISASHNPPEYNGFKLTRARAVPMSGETGLQDLLRLSQEGVPNAHVPAGQVVRKDYLGTYVDSITRGRIIHGLKVAIDTGNGMAGTTTPRVLERFPDVQVVPLFTELDGRFPNHLANPLEESTLDALKAAVNREKCDLGVAFDGDGDRVAFVTAAGQVVRGDVMTALLAERQLRKHAGAIIGYDLRSSWAVPEAIRAAGGEPIQTRVGHSFIKALMREKGAHFAGELSMHYYFKDFYYTDNGDYAMLELLELITETKKPLSELIAPFVKYHQSGEINLKVTDPAALLAAVEAHFRDGKIEHLDGLSIDYPDWHLNLRASNTEPVVRLNMEAKASEVLKAKRNELAELIAPFRAS